MGRIARVLSYIHSAVNGDNVSRVVSDPGGGANVSSDDFRPVGDDSSPLPDDYCINVGTERTGGAVVVGYIDPANAPKSQPGEKRIYSRDDSGAVVAEMWLKSDGSATVSNDSGSILLAADGTATISNDSGLIELLSSGAVNLNGVTIDASGNITAPGKIISGAADLAVHTHTQPNDTGGDTQSPTGPPV